jgi:hypothetical protein
VKANNLIVGLVVLAAVGAGGYWLGGRPHGSGDTTASATQSAAAGAGAPKARKLLYYRNPMGLPDTSPTPKKDPMGMDYIPVYEGEDEDSGQPGAAGRIRIGTEKIQKLGVRTEAVTRRALGKTVRAAGRVEPDERRVHVISPKFEGYVERSRSPRGNRCSTCTARNSCRRNANTRSPSKACRPWPARAPRPRPG